MMRICCECKIDKDLDKDYYRAGKWYQKRCKRCHNKQKTIYNRKCNKIYKKVGFNKLEIEVKEDIIKLLNEKIPYTKICKKYNINYFTFTSWKRKNLIILS